MNPRTVRLLKRVGYPLLGVVSFVAFLYLTLPYERLRQLIEDQAASSGEIEVSIGDLGPSLFFGLSAEDVALRILPKPRARSLASPVADASAEPPPSPQVLRFEDISVNVGLLTLLGVSRSLDLELRFLGGGEVELALSGSPKEGTEVELKATGVKASSLQAAGDGPPLGGTLTANAALRVPPNGLPGADGTLTFACDGCTFGDGKALLKVPGNPWLAGGITVPRIRLGRVAGDVQLNKGTARLNKLAASSPDIKLELQGTVMLQQPLPFSRLDLKLRLKLEDALKAKLAAFELIEGQLRRFKTPDGFIALPITGTMSRPQVHGLMGGGMGRGFPPS